MNKGNNLPKGWKLATIKEVVKKEKYAIVDGPFGTQMKVHEFVDSGIPLIEMRNIDEDKFKNEFRRYITKEKLDEVKRSAVLPGDIIISKTGSLGYVAEVPVGIEQAIITSRLAKIAVDWNLIEKGYFINYLLFLREKGFWHKIAKGTTMKILNVSQIANTEIPLPPLPEQRAIVAKIEELFSELENGRQQLLKAQEQLKVYRQSLLKAAFEGKEQTSVGELFEFIGGGTPSKKENKYWQGEIPWASVKDVKGDYLTNTQDRISEEGLRDSASNMAKPNDVILITRISPGKTIITKIATAINQDLKIVKPKFETTPKFIFYVFKSIEWECIKKSSGTTVLGINLTNLRGIPIPKMSLLEQTLIVPVLEGKLTICDKIEETINQGLKQSETLRKSILKSAFEGRLN